MSVSAQYWGAILQPLLQWASKKYYILSVCLDLGIRHVMRMRLIVICGLLRSTIFFHVLLKGKIFAKKNTKHKMRVLTSSTTFVRNISHSKQKWARYDGRSSCKSTRYSCPILKKLEFSGQIFEKYWNIKIHANPSSESRVVLCGRTDRRTDMTKLTVAFRNFANTPKNETKSETWVGMRLQI
jgi:hypothetical protein